MSSLFYSGEEGEFVGGVEVTVGGEDLLGGGVADGIGYGENGSTEVDEHGSERVAEVVDADRGQVSCGCVVGEEGVDAGFVYRGFATEEERGLRGIVGKNFFQRCADGGESDGIVFGGGDFIWRAIEGMAGIGFVKKNSVGKNVGGVQGDNLTFSATCEEENSEKGAMGGVCHDGEEGVELLPRPDVDGAGSCDSWRAHLFHRIWYIVVSFRPREKSRKHFEHFG